MPCAAAFSMCTRRKRSARCASSFLATKSSPSGSLIPRPSALRVPWMKLCCLPLTETPVSEELLGAVHARLSGKRITGNEEIIEQAVRAGGVTVFPGWEFYAPVAGANHTIFDLLPRALVLTDEPEALRTEFDHVWSRIEQAHESSGVGNLVRPADLYLAPEDWWQKLPGLPGADVEHLDIERSDDSAAAISFHTQPAPRFHGSVPAMLEEVKKLIAESKRVLIAVPNTGEVERLADIFSEYAVSFRLGSRTRSGESYADETSYFSGEVLTATLAKAYVPDGVIFPDANLAILGARDLFDESDAVVSRPAAAEIEDLGISLRFPRLAGWRLRRPRRARHRAVPGAEGNQPGQRQRGIHVAGVRRRRAALCPADAARPGAEIPFVGRGQAGTESSGHGGLGQDQSARAQGHEGHDRRAAQALRRAQDRAGPRLLHRQRMDARVRRRLRIQRDRRSANRHRRRQARHGIDPAHGSPAVRRRGLRQDGNRHARGFQGHQRQQAGGGAGADHRPRLPALRNFQAALCGLSRHHRDDQPLPLAEAAERNSAESGSRQESIS